MQRRSFLVSGLAFAGATLFMNTPTFAAAEIFTGIVPGVAVGGYDSVSYFTAGEPTKGDEKFSTTYKGAKWLFSSQNNLDMFVANPEKYAPQYGGYCAYAASKGALAKGDPEAWTIHDEKLYLNFSKSVRGIWRQDIPGNIKKADANFPGLVGK
ncbi:YHS domain-containing (seleno)protein [Maritalea sp.]|uniref:YHS domain-containing (seleno)protein n=1 Tax=Maritalea sp. TaxID=2003361 RepID=UPI003EF0C331